MMPMKNRRSAQIASVMLALGLLTTYVVYSQLQSARSVAPSSKLILLDEGKKPETSGKESTNGLTRQMMTVAPGSKSMAPVVALSPGTSASATNSLDSGARRVMVAPGSKYGPVFAPSQAQVALRLKFTPPQDQTNTAASIIRRPQSISSPPPAFPQ
jgi:hypothetical protein